MQRGWHAGIRSGERHTMAHLELLRRNGLRVFRPALRCFDLPKLVYQALPRKHLLSLELSTESAQSSQLPLPP